MKLTEKAEKARATFKNRCKQSVQSRFLDCGRSVEKVGKCRKKPAPFPDIFRLIPNPFVEKVSAKFLCLTRVLPIRCPFSAFSENQFWVHRRARPVATGKMPVTMRPDTLGQRPKPPTACEPSVNFLRGKFLEKISRKIKLVCALAAPKGHRKTEARNSATFLVFVKSFKSCRGHQSPL
jgi:hypothetical protein